MANGPIMYSSDAGLNQSLGNLARVLGQALGTYQSNQNQNTMNSSLQQALQILPEDASPLTLLQTILGSNVPMGTAVDIFKHYTPSQGPKVSEGEREKLIALTRAQKTLQRFDSLIEKGNVGTALGVQTNPFANLGKKGEDRAELQKLGQSLIPLVASGVSIRNQKEFDEYSKVITNPNATIANLKGATKALKDMINDELNLRTGKATEDNQISNERPPLSSFYRE